MASVIQMLCAIVTRGTGGRTVESDAKEQLKTPAADTASAMMQGSAVAVLDGSGRLARFRVPGVKGAHVLATGHVSQKGSTASANATEPQRR
mmetsp:Transcript_30577/g.47908  ORF Transcript_30577/g.47908 Transcript_30577/m.47908 type:complete len:92 (+) Transcript_30577:1-276(+)